MFVADIGKNKGGQCDDARTAEHADVDRRVAHTFAEFNLRSLLAVVENDRRGTGSGSIAV